MVLKKNNQTVSHLNHDQDVCKKNVSEKDTHRQKWLHDLETVFDHALSCEKFSAALKAKEMIAKVYGWMGGQTMDLESKPISSWSDDEIDHAVSLLEKSVEAETGVEPTYKDLQSSA